MEPRDLERLGRYFAGEGSASERAAVEAWIEADPDRRAECELLRAAWDAAEVKPAAVDATAAWQRTSRRMDRRIPVARTRWRARPLLAAAGLLVVIAASMLATSRFRENARSQHQVEWLRHAQAPVGRVDTTALPDGSTAILAPGSTLDVATGFGDADRLVRLTGEAYFQVAHDPARPFSVHAAHSVTRVLGTRFSVSAYDGDSVVQVIVQSGRVSLASDSTDAVRPTELTAGTLARLAATGPAHVTTGVDAAARLAWTTGRLAFDRARLDEVAAQVGRWYGLDIRLADSTIAARQLTARFDGHSAEQVLDVIALTLELTWSRDGTRVELARAAR